MLFVRRQGLSTQQNMCSSSESKGGFRLFAGGFSGGFAAFDAAVLACGGIFGPANDDDYAGNEHGTFARIESPRIGAIFGGTPLAWLIEEATGTGKGQALLSLLRGRIAKPASGSMKTQDTGIPYRLHALFTTLNIRDRQSHVRRLCRSTLNGDHLNG